MPAEQALQAVDWPGAAVWALRAGRRPRASVLVQAAVCPIVGVRILREEETCRLGRALPAAHRLWAAVRAWAA